MFGGLAFMTRGYMFLGIVGDVLMARVGSGHYDEALARPHVRPMDFTGRPMTGHVFIDPPGFESDSDLSDWIQRCHRFVQSLPPKKPKTRFDGAGEAPATPDQSTNWQATNSHDARLLTEARLQLHHAAQFGTAMGISYLKSEADDSHTNLVWDAGLAAVMARAVDGKRGAVAVGIRVADLTLIVTRDGSPVTTIPLDGMTTAATADATLAQLALEGLDPGRFTLARHFDIPAHPVARGAAFDAQDQDTFAELSRWFGNAALELGRIAKTVPGASEIRVWPHHFDIATLITIGPGASTGAGMVPGDGYYDEPYFYVNTYPQPLANQLTDPLAGSGMWHTRDWIGAVLPGSRVGGSAAEQEAQVQAFLDASLAACRALVSG